MLPLNAASPNRWCLTTYSTLWTYINSNKQLQTWLNFISIFRECSLAIWQILCELVRLHWTHLATDKVNCVWHIVHPSAKLSAITWTSMILLPSIGRGFAAKCRWLWWHPVTVRLPHNFIIIDTYSRLISSHLLTFAEEFAFFTSENHCLWHSVPQVVVQVTKAPSTASLYPQCTPQALVVVERFPFKNCVDSAALCK